MSTRVYSASTRVHSASTRVYSASTRVHSASTRVYSASTRVYSASTRVHSTSTRVYSASTRVHSTSTRVYSASTRVHSASTRVHSASTRVYSASTRVHSASTRVYSASTRVYSASTRVYSASTRVYSASTRVYSASTRVYSASTRVHSASTRVHSASTRVYSASTRVHSASTRVYSTSTRVYSASTCVYSASTRVYSASTRVQDLGPEIVGNAFDGVNTCLFAYGQRGSGKTYSIVGAPTETDKGLLLRVCADLFAKVTGLRADVAAAVDVSFVELYNERAFDLLRPPKPQRPRPGPDDEGLRVREHPEKGPYVEGLTWLRVGSYAEVEALVHRIQAQALHHQGRPSHTLFSLTLTQRLPIPEAVARTMAAPAGPALPLLSGAFASFTGDPGGAAANPRLTKKPSVSSPRLANKPSVSGGARKASAPRLERAQRSSSSSSLDPPARKGSLVGGSRRESSALTPVVPQPEGPAFHTRVSTLTLCDLAGPDKGFAPGADPNKAASSSLFKSISTLSRVMQKLSSQREGEAPFLPYRESVLTWLLRDKLTGDCHTLMLATVSPFARHYDATVATLQFADRARRIPLRPVLHSRSFDTATVQVVRQIMDNIAKLTKTQDEIMRLLRWRHKQKATQEEPALGASAGSPGARKPPAKGTGPTAPKTSKAPASPTTDPKMASGLDRKSSGLDRTTSGLDRTTSGLDRTTSGLDRTTSGLDRTTSGLDRTTSGLDRKSSGLDRTASGVDGTASPVAPSLKGRSHSSAPPKPGQRPKKASVASVAPTRPGKHPRPSQSGPSDGDGPAEGGAAPPDAPMALQADELEPGPLDALDVQALMEMASLEERRQLRDLQLEINAATAEVVEMVQSPNELDPERDPWKARSLDHSPTAPRSPGRYPVVSAPATDVADRGTLPTLQSPLSSPTFREAGRGIGTKDELLQLGAFRIEFLRSLGVELPLLLPAEPPGPAAPVSPRAALKVHFDDVKVHFEEPTAWPEAPSADHPSPCSPGAGISPALLDEASEADREPPPDPEPPADADADAAGAGSDAPHMSRKHSSITGYNAGDYVIAAENSVVQIPAAPLTEAWLRRRALSNAAKRALLTVVLCNRRRGNLLPLPLLEVIFDCGLSPGGLVASLGGHTGGVTCLTVHDDLVWTGARDNTIRMWDAAGRLKGECLGHRGWVFCLAPLNGLMWSGSGDHTIRLWTSRGLCVRVIEAHEKAVTCLTVFNEEMWSGSGDKTIRVWDETGEPVREQKGHQRGVFDLTIVQDTVWSRSLDRSIRIWDEYGKCGATLREHTGAVYNVVVLRHRVWTRVWTSSEDHRILLWDDEGRLLAECDGHSKAVYCLTAVRDCVWSGSDDCSVGIWDWEGDLVRKLTHHRAPLSQIRTHLDYVFTAADDGSLFVCDVRGTLLRKCAPREDSVKIMATVENAVWAGVDDGEVCIFEGSFGLQP